VPAVPSEELLTTKAGPLPIWAWGVIGLGLAYAYSRYKANKASTAAAATQTAATSAGEPSTGAPYYVIENNGLGGVGGGGGSNPVSPPSTAPVVSPPGTSPNPPIGGLGGIIQGGSPARPAPGTGVNLLAQAGLPVSGVQAASALPAAQAATFATPTSTYAQIGAPYGVTGSQLYAYNTTTGVRSPAMQAQLLSQGQNVLPAGQKVLIPTGAGTAAAPK
jgi:hypothetical protein